MLGTVKPYMPSLSDEAKRMYNAFYCGLCETLSKQNGFFTRFLLSYDMALTAMLYDDFHSESGDVQLKACAANPFRKKEILSATKGTAFAADVLIMLAYFKILDNIRDEKFIKKAGFIILSPYFRLKYRQAKKRHPHLAKVFESENLNQQKAERGDFDTDSLALPTANMVKAIMAECCGQKDSFAAGQFGFFLGRVIYLLDALQDRAEDEKENKFNIFNICRTPPEEAKAECFMALGEMSYWYKQLDLKNSKEVADNIIYMSLARSIQFAGISEGEKNG